MYNPFTPFSIQVLKELVAQRHYCFVVQRFHWFGIVKGMGFMVTDYENREEAEFHISQLHEKEGKILHISEDLPKLEALLKSDSGYKLFWNKLKEENWNKRMLKVYEKSIINFLRAKTSFTRKDAIDILFTLEFGRVIATVSNGDKEYKFNAKELIQ